ncbi:hypothetical protein [Eubacterium ventriosum]|nr:hypothetical protein [Eubacterium ventriosum]
MFDDVIPFLIELLEKQEGIKITYELREEKANDKDGRQSES